MSCVARYLFTICTFFVVSTHLFAEDVQRLSAYNAGAPQMMDTTEDPVSLPFDTVMPQGITRASHQSFTLPAGTFLVRWNALTFYTTQYINDLTLNLGIANTIALFPSLSNVKSYVIDGEKVMATISGASRITLTSPTEICLVATETTGHQTGIFNPFIDIVKISD